MGNTIGSKIELSGEKEFRTAISNINNQMKTLRSEMKLVTSEFDKNDTSTEALTSANKVLYKQIDKQKEKIETLGKALSQAKEQYGENDSKTLKWQQSLNNAQADLNKLTRELQSNEEKIKSSKIETDGLGKETKELGKKFEETGEKTSVFGDVLKANLASEAIIAGVKKISDEVQEVSEKVIQVGADFKASMSQVAATMSITAEEIDKGSDAYEQLEDKAKECGATTKYTASEAAEALNYEALAGYNVKEATETLPDVLNLASAGNYDLARASDQLTDSLTALGKDVDYASTFVDQLAKTSQKSNTNIQQLGDGILQVGGTAKSLTGGTIELCTSLGLLADNGIKASEGGTKLRNIILALNPTTKKAIAAWNELNLTAYNTDGNLKPLQQTVGELKLALQGMTEQEKTDILTKMFNKTDLKAVNALLGTTDERWTQLSNDIQNSTGCAQEMADTLNNNLKGKLTIMGSSLEALGISIFEKFDHPMQDAVENATKGISKLNDEVSGDTSLSRSLAELGEQTGEFTEKAINLGIRVLPVIIDGASWLIENFDTIIRGITSISAGMLTYKSAMGILKVVDAYKKLKIAEEGLTATQAVLNGTMKLNPVVAIAGAVVALTTAVVLHAKSVKESTKHVNNETEEFKAQTNSVRELKDSVTELAKEKKQIIETSEAQAFADDKLIDKLIELDKSESLSTGQMQQKAAIIKDLNERYPEMALKIDEMTGKLNLSGEAMKSFVEKSKETAMITALQDKYVEVAKKQADAEINKADAEEKLNQIEQELIIAQQERYKAEKDFQEGLIDRDAYNLACEKLGDVTQQEHELQEQVKLSNETISECENSFSDIDKTVDKYTQTVEKAADSTSEMQAVSEETQEAIKDTWEDTEKALNKYAESLDDVKEKDKVTAEQLLKNQNDRIKEMSSYNKQVQELAKKAPEYIVEYLTSGGMDALETIKTVNSMSKEELDKFISNYDKLGNLVNESTVSTIEGVYGVIETASGEFVQKGEKTVTSYAKGIKNASPEAESTSKELAQSVKNNLAVNTAESTGAKVTEQYASGILSAKARVDKAIADTSTTGMEKFKKVANEMQETGILFATNYKSGMESKKSDVESSAGEIKQEAYNKFSDVAEKSKGFGSYFGEGLASGIRSKKKEVSDAAKELANTAEKTTKETLDIHSPSRKAKALGKYYAQGLAEGIKENQKYAKASAGEISKAILEKAEKHLSNYEVYHKLSAKDEMNYWDNIRKECKKGTQARIDADDKYLKAKKTYTEEIKKKEKEEAKAAKDKAKAISDANKEWAKNQKEVFAQLKSDVKSLWEEYDNQVQSRANSIASGAGGIKDLFDYTANISQYENKDTLTQKLKSQVEGLNQWKKQLSELRKKGVEESLVDELEGMGAQEGLGYVKLINSMSQAELQEYNSLWKQKQSIAKKEATAELTDLKKETNTKIKEITKEANTQINEYFTQYKNAIKKAGGELNTTMATFATKVASNGELAITKTTKKIKSAANSTASKSDIKSATNTLAKQVKNATGTFESAGKTLAQATVKGMKNELSSAKVDLSNLVKSTASNKTKEANTASSIAKVVTDSIKGLTINVDGQQFGKVVEKTVKGALS